MTVDSCLQGSEFDPSFGDFCAIIYLTML